MITNETRGSEILNIARSAGPEQILGFTRLQKSSFLDILLLLNILKIATAIISTPQFENANEINFQNQISSFFSNFPISNFFMSMGPT